MTYRSLLALCSLAISMGASAWGYDFAGTVIDADEDPVESATVWISQDRRVRKATTDARGRFKFENVDVGPMEVVARKEGLALGGTAGEIVDNVEVVLRLVEPDSITVRVTNRRYDPLQGGRVKSMTINGRFEVAVEDLVSYGFPSSRSNREGFLSIHELPKGAMVSFTISHRKYAEASMPSLPVGIEVDVPLPYGWRVRGRVTDTSGNGIERARVSVFRLLPEQQREFAEVFTDRDGFYSAIVPTGTYHVVARHLDFAIPDPIEVEVDDDSQDTHCDLVLPPPHLIVARTVDLEGLPVAMVKASYSARGMTFAESYSDSMGRLRITVSSGKGLIEITPPRRMITVAHPEIPIEITKGFEFDVGDIVIKPLPDLRGKILLPEGIRKDKVFVRTLGLDPPLMTITDDEGNFSIPLDYVPEKSRVRLRAEHALRFLRGDFIIRIDVDDDEPLELSLQTFAPNLAEAPEDPPNDLAHMVGKPAPPWACAEWLNLEQTGPDKPTLKLKDLRGKVVVLTLWGGFDVAGASRRRIDELRMLNRLYSDIGDVVIVSVHDAGIRPVDVIEYVEDYGVEFPVCCDLEPFLTFDIYNTNTIPQTILIDKEGILRYFYVEGRLMELIKDLRRRR